MRKITTRLISAALAASMMLSVCPVSAFATYRQAEAEKAVAAYAAQGELDDENSGVSVQANNNDDETRGIATQASDQYINPVTSSTYSITSGGTYHLRGGNYTVSASAIIINTTEPVTLEVDGDITATSTTNAFIVVNKDCNLTVIGGDHSITAVCNVIQINQNLKPDATVTIESGTFETTTAGATIIGTASGKIIVHGGTIKNSGNVSCVNGVDIEMTGGTVSGGSRGLTAKKIKVTGGTIQNMPKGVDIYNEDNVTIGGNVTFKNNTADVYLRAANVFFTLAGDYAGNAFTVTTGDTLGDTNRRITVSSTSTAEMAQYVKAAADGYSVYYDADGQYLYIAKTKAASIISPDDAEATTISSAGTWTVKGGTYTKAHPIVIDGTSADDEVVLNIDDNVAQRCTDNDCTLIWVKSPCKLTVNGNSHTLTASNTSNSNILKAAQNSGATVTLDGCVVGSASRASFVVYDTDLTLKNTTLTNSSRFVEVYSWNKLSTLTVDENVTFNGDAYFYMQSQSKLKFTQNASIPDTLKIYSLSVDGGSSYYQITSEGCKNISEKVELVNSSGGKVNGYTIDYNSEKGYTYAYKPLTTADFTWKDNGDGIYTLVKNGESSFPGSKDYTVVYQKKNGDNWETLDKAPTASEPGNYKVIVKYAEGNAELSSDDWTFEVVKQAETTKEAFTVKMDANTAYTGNPIGAEVAIDGSTEGITVKYKDAEGKDVEGKPTKPGKYTIFVDFDGNKHYTAVKDMQVGEFTIVPGTLSKDIFEPTEKVGEVKIDNVVNEDELGKFQLVYYDQNGEKVSEDTAPTELGTYKVGFRYDASEYYQAIDYGPVDGWTYEVKETPAANLFHVEVAADTTYTGAPIGAEVTINGSTEGITVKYQDEHGNITPAKPTNAGTYTVLIDYAGSDKYEAVNDLEVGEFTIKRADLTADDFTYDENDHRVHSEKVKDTYIHVTYRRTDEEGPALAFTDELPNIAGTYEITYTAERTANYNSMAETAVTETYTVDKLKAEDISESDLLVSIPFSPVYNGKAEEVTADVLDSNKLPGTVTVNYYTDASCAEESKLPEGELPTNAGTYYFTITVGESYNNEEVTLTPENNSFTIKPASEVVEGEVEVKVPENLYEDKDEKGITLDFGSTGLTEDDVTITYTNTDTSEVLPEGSLPKERGTYSYTVKVKTTKGNYAAGAVLAKGVFTIEAKPYPIDYDYSAESGSIPDDIAMRFSWTAKDGEDSVLSKDDSELSVATIGTNVTLSWTEKDMEYSITGLTAAYTEDGAEKTVEGTFNKDSKTFTFEMPNAPVTIQVSVNASTPVGPIDPGTGEPINPEPDFPGEVGDDEGFGTAVAVVAGGAAVGGAAYLIGTQVYLTNVFGSVPANRQELALALWNKAGKPEPQSTVLYTDISAEAVDSQKAARWCVEQGLLKDSGETFKPNTYTFRAQVIKAWNDAKDKGLVK